MRARTNISLADQRSETPVVSIVLPVYNGEETLSNAIKSILYQTYPHWELIVVDDGSKDNTLAIARKFNDNRIKLISESANKGISARLNQAIESCQGSYVARMDADDISFPARIAKQVCYMQENSHIDLLGTAILVYSGNGTPQGTVPVRQSHSEICQRPWRGFYLAHPTWFGKVEWFLKNPYCSFADRAEDQHLLYRTYNRSKFACLPEVLLGYKEEPRVLEKMFVARYIFLKALVSTAIERRKYFEASKIIGLQCAKILGDFLNNRFGIKCLRNPLLPIEPSLLRQWSGIWHQLTANFDS